MRSTPQSIAAALNNQAAIIIEIARVGPMDASCGAGLIVL